MKWLKYLSYLFVAGSIIEQIKQGSADFHIKGIRVDGKSYDVQGTIKEEVKEAKEGK